MSGSFHDRLYLVPVVAGSVGLLLTICLFVEAFGGRSLIFYNIWRLCGARVDELLAPQKDALFRNDREGVLKGRVVEVGAGLGHGLKWYASNDTRHVTLVEPNVMMGNALCEAARLLRLRDDQWSVLSVSGATLPLPSSSVDAVVCILTLCSVACVEDVVREAHRILRPGGKLFFLEHVRSPNTDQLATAMRMMLTYSGAWWALAGGCQLERDPCDAATSAAHWSGVEVTRFVVPRAPMWQRHHASGILTK